MKNPNSTGIPFPSGLFCLGVRLVDDNDQMIPTLKTKCVWLRWLVALFLAGLALWVFSYHTWEFKGGLDISDSGVFSYPRYYARIGRLPLWEAGEYQFTVRGLPPGPLELLLLVEEATDANRTMLTSSSISVGVSITDNSGNQVCSASGRLSLNTSDPWILASHGRYFWHPRCTHIQTRRLRTYIVKVNVRDVDTRLPQWTIMPVLRGGGIELP
jgi:hypothetical protein